MECARISEKENHVLMEQINHLSNFFNAIAGDPRISITHIGIYAALLQCWKQRNFENPINVFSSEIMCIAKISASTTYHKIINNLSSYGYIKYEPSYKRNQGSKIFMITQE